MIKAILILCIIQTVIFSIIFIDNMIRHDVFIPDTEWQKFMTLYSMEQRRLPNIHFGIHTVRNQIDEIRNILKEMQKDINYLWNVTREHERKNKTSQVRMQQFDLGDKIKDE